MVASSSPHGGGGQGEQVSIPFIAGQWSLHGSRHHGCGADRRVSIPFIAGQWSLPPTRRMRRRDAGCRFNPLHCGAVVASGTHFVATQLGLACLNPLHCGAVVASGKEVVDVPEGSASLNPLHCGAVVASGLPRFCEVFRDKSQSPSLRGSGRFTFWPH